MVSVIVPSRNEADNLPRLIGAIHDALAAVDHEIVCVDDSDDETPDVLAALAQDDPRLRVDHRRVRNGLAGAVIDGVRQARGDMVAVIDADLQHPPQCLASLLAAVEAGADVAVASRFVPGGDDGGLPPTRKLVSFVARFVVRACLSRTRSVRDVTSGFFLLRRSVIEGVALTPTGWKILLEVLQLGRYSAVVEVPMHFGRRRAGRSKLTWREARDLLTQVVRLLRHSPDDRRLARFAAVGLAGVGVNTGVFVALDRLGTPVPIAAPAAALVAMVSNFLLHDRWTYRDRRAGPAAGRAVRAVAVQAAGVAIDALVATAVHSWLDAAPVVANLGGIAAAAAWNYALFYRLVWPRTAAAAPAHVIDT